MTGLRRAFQRVMLPTMERALILVSSLIILGHKAVG